jgi:hypothetical protein
MLPNEKKFTLCMSHFVQSKNLKAQTFTNLFSLTLMFHDDSNPRTLTHP